jgi:hypothetical protein
MYSNPVTPKLFNYILQFMLKDDLDIEDMLGKPISGEEYIIYPSQLGHRKDLFQEIGTEYLSDESFRKLCYLHGSWQVPAVTSFLKEIYGLSDEQKALIELLLENAIIHGNENDPDKPISIKVLKGRNTAFKITDQGQGFYPKLIQEDFQNGNSYSRGLGSGTMFAAKCPQSLVRYSNQGRSVEVLCLNSTERPKPYFTNLDLE